MLAINIICLFTSFDHRRPQFHLFMSFIENKTLFKNIFIANLNKQKFFYQKTFIIKEMKQNASSF